MKKYPLLFFFLLALTVFLASAPSVSAQDPTPSDDEVNAIARQLYCPVCENTPLDVCPTTACHDWRELIRQMLADGKSPAEIKQYFVDYYGAKVLAEPPAKGINWLVYVVPPLAFLAGAVLLVLAFRTWKRPAPQKTPIPQSGTGTSQPTDDPYISRLEDELKKRK